MFHTLGPFWGPKGGPKRPPKQTPRGRPRQAFDGPSKCFEWPPKGLRKAIPRSHNCPPRPLGGQFWWTFAERFTFWTQFSKTARIVRRTSGWTIPKRLGPRCGCVACERSEHARIVRPKLWADNSQRQSQRQRQRQKQGQRQRQRQKQRQNLVRPHLAWA